MPSSSHSALTTSTGSCALALPALWCCRQAPRSPTGRCRSSMISRYPVSIAITQLPETKPMVMFWAGILAVSILLYVLLDGFDLGVGMLFGLARGEARRYAMLSAVSPVWDGNETWLVVTGVVLWGAFPVVYATL